MAVSLEGVRVIETASAIAGPTAGRFLADWGADVIHVDYATKTAQLVQFQAVEKISESKGVIRPSIDFRSYITDRNKRSIILDLSKENGLGIIYRLLEKADVLLSNFRPRELEKFRLQYETLSQLNPKLICAHLTGYGRKGPDKDAPAYGQIAGDSRSGLLKSLQLPGMYPPQTSGCMADLITGLSLACGIMSALFIRERTGIGQEVDVSLFNTMVYAISDDISATLVTGKSRRTVDRKHLPRPTTATYQTKDGRWLILGIPRPDSYWPRFCRAIEREDLEHDPRFQSVESMTENHHALFGILEEAFLTKTFDEWKPRLNEAGCPWSLLQDYRACCTNPFLQI